MSFSFQHGGAVFQHHLTPTDVSLEKQNRHSPANKIFRFKNLRLNERIFERLKYLRIINCHVYLMCNPMCQIDVFNNLSRT